MDQLVMALGPAFAAGLAIQQLLEVADPIVEKAIGGADKKVVLGLIAFGVGLLLAFGAGLRVLDPLGAAAPGWIDSLATAAIVSGGTEGFNSILKFLGYSKQNKKEGLQGNGG